MKKRGKFTASKVKITKNKNSKTRTNRIPQPQITKSKNSEKDRRKREKERQRKKKELDRAVKHVLESESLKARQALLKTTKNKKTIEEAVKGILEERNRLEEMKSILSPVIAEANRRAKILAEKGIPSYALYKAQEEKLFPSKEDFSLSEAYTEADIMSEATRARAFLSDYTSTEYGALRANEADRILKWKGEFGKQWVSESNKSTYNEKAIDTDIAKVAFKAYRKLEEMLEVRIREYGSDNMISYMYDIAFEDGYRDVDNDQAVDWIVEKSYDFLQSEVGVPSWTFEDEFNERNNVLGYIDYVEFKNKKRRGY